MRTSNDNDSVKTIRNFNVFRAAFQRGERVQYASADGTSEIRPIYGLDVADTVQLGRALQFAQSYLTAVEAKDRKASAEWRDELEVLAMHTGSPSIRKVCEGVIGALMS